MSQTINSEPRLSIEALTRHLEKHYPLTIQRITALDLNVYRVQANEEQQPLVARIFPQSIASAVIPGTARLLELLMQQGFPAERCYLSACKTVSHLEEGNGSVLLTWFIQGRRPERSKATFYRLGRLLGRLSLIPVPEDFPRGGAWHHVALDGGVQEEAAATLQLLDELVSSQTRAAESTAISETDQLKRELQRVKNMAVDDLPITIVHPDLVPANVIAQDTGNVANSKWTIIDWAGAGVGRRIFSLGFLIAAASSTGILGLVNAVVKGYLASGATLEPCELDERLPISIYVRLLVLHCYDVAARGKPAAIAVEKLPHLHEMAEKAAERTREVLYSDS